MHFTIGGQPRPDSCQLEIRGLSHACKDKHLENLNSRRVNKQSRPRNDCTLDWRIANCQTPLNDCIVQEECKVSDDGRNQISLPQENFYKVFTDSTEQLPAKTLVAEDRIDEIISYLEKKIACCFVGVKLRFKDYQYKLPRQKFLGLMFELLGPLSDKDLTNLLRRLSCLSQEEVSFDDLMVNFKFNEHISKLYRTPPRREYLDDYKKMTIAEKLHENYREPDKSGIRGGFPFCPKKEIMSATQVVVVLRKLAKEDPKRFLVYFKNLRDTSNPMTIKDQMSRIISEIGISMFREEFQKFWNRFDFARAGQVPLRVFFRSIGLADRFITGKGKEGFKNLEATAQKNRETLEKTILVPHDKPAVVTTTHKSSDAPYDFDVKYFLTRKFREGEDTVIGVWKETSPIGKNQITQYQFRILLERFGIYLSPSEVESFLIRYRFQDDPIDFRSFLSAFVHMSKLKIAANSGSGNVSRGFGQRGSLSTLQRAEDLFIDFIYKNYIKLYRELSSLEVSTGGCVMVQDLVKLLNEMFSLHLTVATVRRSLVKHKVVTDMIVDWAKLLEICSGIRCGGASTGSRCRSAKLVAKNKYLDSAEEKTISHYRRTDDSAKRQNKRVVRSDVKDGKILTPRVEKLVQEIHHICKFRSGDVKKASYMLKYDDLKYITKEHFLMLFSGLGLTLSDSDADELWNLIPNLIKKDGKLIKVSDIVHHFATLTPKRLFAIVLEDQRTGDSFKDSTRATDYFPKDYALRKISPPPSLLSPCCSTISIVSVTSVEGDVPLEEESSLKGKSTPAKKEGSATQRELPSSLLRFGKQLNRNWEMVEGKLQDFDPDGSGYLGMSFLKAIAEMTDTELNNEAINYIQREFSNRSRSELIDYVLLFQTIKSKASETTEPVCLETERHTKVGDSNVPLVAVIDKVRCKCNTTWRRLRRALIHADTDNDGYIGYNQLSETLRSFDVILNRDELYFLASFFDEEMEGRVPYKYLIEYLFGDIRK